MRFSALHQPFEARAREHPDAGALLGADGASTYGELERRSARIAGWLAAQGVGRDAIVAICASRSPELIAAMLGVLRAGGAYLPIDPSLPRRRISTLLADSQAHLLLTDRVASERLPDLEGTEIAAVAGRSQIAAGASPGPPAPEDLPYVIYTSGSTGTPKGVLCTHAGIDNRLRWMQSEFGLTGEDVVLHKTSIGFDVSVWEIFWPLSAGARLALAPAGAERDPELLGDFIRGSGVTVAHFVPAMLRMFVRSGEAERTPGLRLVVCSGEALSPELRDEFLSASPAQLHNLYGPTEASIDVTHHACRQRAPAGGVPIGRPIDNVRVRVLGEGGEILPPGAEGEIQIGGVALARGYHRRPDLTAAAFVPDPFEPGSVLYRTGDRGRWRQDGELEYLGRRDDQVKVRGTRIELGEVEAALSALPAVRDCAVLPPEDDGGLIGFVDEAAPEPAVLREQLAERLPEAAIPAEFVRLAAIPRLASGKVDRAGLRDLPAERRAATAGRRPEGEAEKALAQIWSEVLDVPEASLSAGDNFFTLGGDSIRSIEVVFRARSAGLQLTTQDVFRWQTLEAIAAAAGAAGGLDGPARAAARQPFSLLDEGDREQLPAGVTDAYPLSSLLRGLMAEAAANPDYLLYTTTLTLDGPYDAAALQSSVRELVRRHPILRSAFAVDGFSEPLQLVFGEAAAEVEEIDAREMPEDAWAGYFRAWIERERRAPLDFAAPPLFRFTAHRRPGRLHLTLTEPYLDGWSMTLLLTELLSLYDAGLAGREAALPTPPEVTMADLVEAERTHAWDGHRAAWRARLAEADPTRLPRVFDGDENLGAPERFPVPVATATSRRLRELSQELSVPLKTVLLAAHLRVVAALSGHEDVVCGLMVNGRPETRDGERAIGMFLNVVPLRVDVGPGTWTSLIRGVHEAETDVLRWRQYPYQQLLRDLGGRRPFETIFNFTRFRPYTDWSGEAVELLEIEGTDQTYFGLTVQTGLGLDGEVEFAIELNPDGFSRRQATELVSVYEEALTQIASAPQSRHESAPILPARRQPRRRDRPAAAPERIEALLARRAADSPDRTAFIAGSERCSYAMLDRRSEALAHRVLDALDGRAPRRIAIHMRRSIPALEATFAALKLGAAFLPLDPAAPPPRSVAILCDAQPELLLVEEEVEEEDGETAAPVSRSKSSSPADPAHILYTSGSSGAPKGVLTPHTALLNRLRWISRRFPAADGDLYCASGASGFVDTVTALFSGLLDGVPVFLPPDPPLPPAEFAKAIDDAGVTRLTLVPSILRDLLGEIGEDEARRLLGGVRLWLLSGEPLPVELARRLRSVAPESTILNLYGSTEVAGDVTAHVYSGRERGAHVPAGTAIDGAEVRVLDRYGRDLPIGVSGEVVISGDALACGYLGDEALTRKRFPEAGEGGPRRFRSGDLGRLRPDGSLQLLGRLDRQLKVNGVRVAPAEVESEIAAHYAVREAAVCGIERPDGCTRLAAFVVGEATGAELRAFLAGRLPSALVPGTVVSLPRLPRNPSGKVDYRRLEAEARPDAPAPSPAPAASAAERSILEIWREVLGADEIGLDDDFFELGGDSLLAARVLARIDERLGARISLRELFDFPTPRECAARIGTGESSRRNEVAGVGH